MGIERRMINGLSKMDPNIDVTTLQINNFIRRSSLCGIYPFHQLEKLPLAKYSRDFLNMEEVKGKQIQKNMSQNSACVLHHRKFSRKWNLKELKINNNQNQCKYENLKTRSTSNSQDFS